ncbi:MAG: cation diffusion facilitator family transporter [Halobacteriales archaeon]|nr:cation diffusion facilitator family transporter [Halobacteriales archaeon]
MAVRGAIRAAFLANVAIALFKLGAALISGSSAMLAESYHSLSDTLNQVFLFVGLRGSEKPADEKHPFGYGKARYFWSFVVAVLLFGVAGTLSLVEGVNKLLHPTPLDWEDAKWSFAALAFASVFEGFALAVSVRELRRKQEELDATGLMDALRRSKDATLATVVFEDSLAQVGVAIATVGISATLLTGDGRFDGAASLLIGLVLMGFAIILAKQNQDLLIGEAMDPALRLRIIRALEAHPLVNRVISLKTMHMSPRDVLVACEINFRDGLTTDDLERAIDEVETVIRTIAPQVKTCFVEPQDMAGTEGKARPTPTMRMPE